MKMTGQEIMEKVHKEFDKLWAKKRDEFIVYLSEDQIADIKLVVFDIFMDGKANTLEECNTILKGFTTGGIG